MSIYNCNVDILSAIEDYGNLVRLKKDRLEANRCLA